MKFILLFLTVWVTSIEADTIPSVSHETSVLVSAYRPYFAVAEGTGPQWVILRAFQRDTINCYLACDPRTLATAIIASDTVLVTRMLLERPMSD